MTLVVDDTDFQLHVGDVREVLADLPDESVHCVVTSPPYWGLRDYGSQGQFGLEPTPDEYVANMVAVFREVLRVLRRDGTCWLNIGDSYARSAGPEESKWATLDTMSTGQRRVHEDGGVPAKKNRPPVGLKPKDLVGIPWRLAFALQADGWYLRSDIIWSKPNPMPESVTDRPTKAHEYLFLLTRSPRYFYDADAIREPSEMRPQNRFTSGENWKNGGGPHRRPDGATNPDGRNRRSVWEIATEPYPDAHFATFPQALVEPCVLAGTSERGCCPVCGAPWERETERGEEREQRPTWRGEANAYGVTGGNHKGRTGNWGAERKDIGWKPTCKCSTSTTTKTSLSAIDAERSGISKTASSRDTNTFVPSAREGTTPDSVPCTVLDPFMGSGTTAVVARRLGRRSIGIELNAEYAELIVQRTKQLSLLA